MACEICLQHTPYIIQLVKVFRNLHYVVKAMSYKLATYLLYQFKGKGNIRDIYTQYTLYIRRAILRGPGAEDNGPLFKNKL